MTGISYKEGKWLFQTSFAALTILQLRFTARATAAGWLSKTKCTTSLVGRVYSPTIAPANSLDFLDSHPGGPNAILRYGGRDATAEFNPIHPPGTLETLTANQRLGPLDTSTLPPAPEMATRTPAPPALPPLTTQLSLLDFEKSAKTALSAKAWAYYSSAADDEYTKAHNAAVFRAVLLRPRIFRDVTTVDLATTLLGAPSRLPVFVSTSSAARARARRARRSARSCPCPLRCIRATRRGAW